MTARWRRIGSRRARMSASVVFDAAKTSYVNATGYSSVSWTRWRIVSATSGEYRANRSAVHHAPAGAEHVVMVAEERLVHDHRRWIEQRVVPPVGSPERRVLRVGLGLREPLECRS